MNLEIFKSTKKLFLTFMIFSFFLSFSIVGIEKLFFSNSGQKIALENAVKKTSERQERFKTFLDHGKNTLLILRNSACFENYLQTSQKENIQNLFLTFVSSNEEFMQLRFIDKDGFEKVRVERKEQNTTPFIEDEKNLQNKSDRYYFKISLEKNLEEVWFSSMDLNEERGEVETPYKPTLRAILPIRHDGKFGGIIIINFFMKEFLQKLTNAPLYDMIIYDDRGFILHHYDEKRSWSYYKSEKLTIKDEFPQFADKLLTTPLLFTDSFVVRKLDLGLEGGVNLLLQLKKAYFKAEIKKADEKYLTLSILVFLFSLVLIYIVMKFYGNALLNLKHIQALHDVLQKLKLRNDLALKASLIGVWEWDFEANELSWDEQIYKIYGYTHKPVDSIYNLWLQRVEPNDIARVEKALYQAMKSNQEFSTTFWITTPSGEKRYLKTMGANELDSSGKLIRMVGITQDITQIAHAEQKFKSLLDFASDGVHIIDTEGNLVMYSHSFAKNLGYEYEEMADLKIWDWDGLFSKEELGERLFSLVKTPEIFETKHKRKDGSIFDVKINAKGIDLDGQLYLYASQRDITKEKELEQKLVEEKNFANSLLESTSMVVLLNHSESFYANKAFLEFFNCSSLEDFQDMYGCLGKEFVVSEHYFSCETTSCEEEWLEKLMQIDEEKRVVSMVSKKDYEPKVFNVQASKVGKNILLSFSDISHKMHRQLELEHQVIHDTLTNAYNREYFAISIEKIIASHKSQDKKTAFAFIDIDFFKTINDTFGHDVGDHFLKSFVHTIKRHSRSEDILIRWGGEEFVLILKVNSQSDMQKALENIREKISQENFSIVGMRTCSIGGTLYEDNEDVEVSLKRADTALYTSKNSGRNRVSIL